MNLFQKLSKRNLLFFLLAFLCLVVLIYSFFPKTTLASILQLDNKDQIVKIEIGTGLQHQLGVVFSESEAQWQNITATDLGNRYVDAVFSEHTIAKDVIRDSMGFYVEEKVAAVRITLGNLPKDYPFSKQVYTVIVGIPNGSTPLYLPLSAEEQMRMQEKLNAEGKGEIAPTEEYHEFDLSHNELFTLDFINKQFE